LECLPTIIAPSLTKSLRDGDEILHLRTGAIQRPKKTGSRPVHTLVNGCTERSYIHRSLTPESQSRRKAEIGLSEGGYDRVDKETLGFL
jgi:hypothetical protein